jgi:hypothetical protein
MRKSKPTCRTVWKEYEKALVYNTQMGCTTRRYQRKLLHRQALGRVEANGLPTPVFNFPSASCCSRYRG